MLALFASETHSCRWETHTLQVMLLHMYTHALIERISQGLCGYCYASRPRLHDPPHSPPIQCSMLSCRPAHRPDVPALVTRGSADQISNRTLGVRSFSGCLVPSTTPIPSLPSPTLARVNALMIRWESTGTIFSHESNVSYVMVR